MDKDDENYDLMCQKRDGYVEAFLRELKESDIELTAWEMEEIEIAFENGFAHGFIAGFKGRRARERQECH